MRIEPLFDKVILEREKLKSGSIIIPQSAEKRNAPAIGRVLAVGKGCEVLTEKMVGKRVIFGVHAGDYLTMPDGSECYIVMEGDIHGELIE